MKITVCIGSSCHVKGSRQVVEQLQYLIALNNVGDKVELNVLMVSDEAGVKVAEEAKGFKAVGEVLEQGKAKKVVVYKYKAKKNERKKQGHRQPFTAVKILEIVAK
jgi:large subunit ribosomal protein L21